MKKVFFVMALLCAGVIQQAAAQNVAVNTPSATAKVPAKPASISWKKTVHQLGEIKQAVPVSVEFEFTNVSKTPVLLTQVQGSCGCTATAYSKEPILPGQTSKVTATYNAAALGSFNKTVTVTTNADTTPYTLTLQGTVAQK